MSAVRTRHDPPINAEIAHQVEHHVEVMGVGGSSPPLGTTNGGCSSMVEPRIVIPVVAGPSPVSHPS